MTNDKTNKRIPDLNVFVVSGTEQPFYTKIGGAWQNTKGGYGVRLDALPVHGELVLLPPKSDADK